MAQTESYLFKLAVLSSMLLGCTTVKQPEPPCYDGWSVDSSGPSKIKKVDALQSREFQKLFEKNQIFECAHEMPSGTVILIARSANTIVSITLQPSLSGYEIVERGWVIGNDY